MKYYIIAGEASGDLHGSNLIKSIRKIDNNSHFRAWGGDAMKQAGAEIIRHYKEQNYMGFTEVVIHLRKILKNFQFCKQDILQYQPDVIIFIDFPGFNLRMAKWAKKHGFRTVYYISPQIWAWKSSRVHTIRKVVDKMLTILPFEKEFYNKYGIDVEYVGHPLLDIINQNNQISFQSEPKDTILLLPGSRKQEIKRMLPIMTAVAKYFPQFQFLIAGVSHVEQKFYAKYNAAAVPVIYNSLYTLFKHAHAAIVTSGTATLETALHNVPLVVCYKGSPLSYQIAKKLIKVKFISLVNLIMNKTVVTELIQQEMNTQRLKEELEKLISNDEKRIEMLNDFKKLKQLLGEGGVSDKAAKIVTEMLKEKKND